MNTPEAYKILERWLLVPVDYENVLPALVAICDEDDFAEYVNKVAKAEYKLSDEVFRDVDIYLENVKNSKSREEILQEKLDAIAGRTKESSEKTDETDENHDLNAHFSEFVQDYASQNTGNSLVRACPRCGTPMTEREEYGSLTTSGVFIMIALFLVINIFCIIPYCFGVGREKKKVCYCDRCRQKIG